MNISKQITMVSTSKLTAKAGFQRPIDPKRVQKIAKEFDDTRMKPVQVADIDGVYYIWDGQHTAAAAKAANGGNDLRVPCIIDKMTYEEAAQHVADQNKNKVNPNSIEVFKAEVEANNPDAMNIHRVLMQHGIKLQKGYSETSTAAIGAIRRVYNYSCPDLDETLTLIREIWECDKDRFNGDIIEGIHRLYHLYKNDYKRKDLIARLSRKPAIYYIRNAKYSIDASSSKVNRVVKLFVKDYNEGRTAKYRLDIDKIDKK